MRKVYIIFLFVTLGIYLRAEVRLPEVLTSNMVLQRNTKVRIWGWATPGKIIHLSTSWLENIDAVTVSENGFWELKLKTTGSQDPQSIRIVGDGSVINLNNILFGEVWVCSGQSNMVWAIVQKVENRSIKIVDADEMIAQSTSKRIRMFRIPTKASLEPQTTVDGEWMQANAINTPRFSAVAYSFAEILEQKLKVPIGMIVAAEGGSKVKAWMSSQALKKFPEIPLPTNVVGKKDTIPTLLYNAMINPIINYTIKGALWYHGESDRENPELYSRLFPALIQSWRNEWRQGSFPFYYVQISPYGYSSGLSMRIREVQLNTLRQVENTGMAVTLDVGGEKDLHPLQKRVVGQRLGLWALDRTYNQSGGAFSGPLYRSMKIANDKVEMSFDYVFSGLELINGEHNNFEIAGRDRKFYPAKAKITESNNLIVWSENVKNPLAVRYAFRDWVEATLFNNEGLPASSFRTDNWE